MYDAIVLAGGSGRRLGGVDKAGVEIGGRTMLDCALDAVATAGTRIVVGPNRQLPAGVRATRERPPGGGPVAAILAGLEAVAAKNVVILACDMPFVDAAVVSTLLAALDRDSGNQADGALLVDEDYRRQPLAAVYRTAPLRAQIDRLVPVEGTPMRDLLAGLSMLEIVAGAGQAWDCDTWTDVERARRRIATPRPGSSTTPATTGQLNPTGQITSTGGPIPCRSDVEEA